MLKERFDAAPSFREYIDAADKNKDLWNTFYHRARVPDDIRVALESLPPLRIAVLSEDWCGDAVNTLPLIARMAEAAPDMELRVFSRDANPDLMNGHLTGGSRSIPVVIVYDERFRELGWWGPRPMELQDWVLDEGLTLPSPDRYRRIRRWYAVDRGRTTMEEVLEKLGGTLRESAA